MSCFSHIYTVFIFFSEVVNFFKTVFYIMRLNLPVNSSATGVAVPKQDGSHSISVCSYLVKNLVYTLHKNKCMF